MSSSGNSGRRAGRVGGGGGGRGRPRGGGGGNRRGGGGGGRGRSNNNNNNNSGYNTRNNPPNTDTGEGGTVDAILMRDEDVLIAFMPYLRNDDSQAREIHEQYQSHQNQAAFLKAAREFLQQQQQQTTTNANTEAKPTTPILSSSTETSAPIEEPTTPSLQQLQKSPEPASTIPASSASDQASVPAAKSLSSSESLVQPSPPLVQTPNSTIQRPVPFVPLPAILTSSSSSTPLVPNSSKYPATSSISTISVPSVSSLESPMKNLLVDDDPVVPVSSVLAHSSPTPIRPATLPIGSKSPSSKNNNNIVRIPSDSPSSAFPTPTASLNSTITNSSTPNIAPKPLFPIPTASTTTAATTPPRLPMPRNNNSSSIIASPSSSVPPSPSSNVLFAAMTPGAGNSSWLPMTELETTATPQAPNSLVLQSSSSTPALKTIIPTTSETPVTTPAAPTPMPASTKKDFGPPKRMWMHFEEQPGRLMANDVPANLGQVLDLRPRQELTAKWMLPLSYLQQHHPNTFINNNPSLRDALFSLTVGLFRRGCTDNGQNASIISKQVLASIGESRSDYPYQVQGNVVVGTVPFYAPRTPGHVVFRLYWQDDPVYTLATGPTLNVRVTAEDLDPTLRFILSNFKGKKVNPTSLSSLHALSLVMEQIYLPNPNNSNSNNHHHHHYSPHHHQQQQQQQPLFESAGRALWGCICEARKVTEACALEHDKTTQKLAALEKEVEALKEDIAEAAKTQAESEDIATSVAVAAVTDEDDAADAEVILDDLAAAAIAADDDDEGLDGGDHPNHVHETGVDGSAGLGGDTVDDENDPTASAIIKLREKTRTLLSGRASSERKWRDSQLAFAGILKAAVTNPCIAYMLRRELIAKMRLEYDLWCPLCEEFAVPASLVVGSDQANASNSKASSSVINNRDDGQSLNLWYRPLNEIPHSAVTGEHFRICRQQRATLQVEQLGFDPNFARLDEILFPKTPRRNSPNHHPADNQHRSMDAAAVNLFNQLSAAMGHLYQDEYSTADFVYQQREIIRSQTEKFVALCDLFPPGTKVAIFGSSANGFGSRQSDLDMCVQLPPGAKLVNDEDTTGSLAMAKLAEILKEGGMQDVDTVRLTARIPIIRFNCPKPLRNGEENEVIECDLSMHNPLAVLNTSLLRTYAEINPVTRVLAAIIKRWAKARDINDPSRHTLSSYGYIIMLLHFLTYHQRTGDGLVVPVAGPQGKPLRQNRQATPLLPNLQWMDHTWPQSPPGTPYRELPALPSSNVRMQHPIESTASVNTYFFRPSDPSQLVALQRFFPGQDLSLAILLCSFFRYYAYEFDFKHHVVSLHSTASRGLVEREAKAETDGWRNYSAALTIEDPFETFYDIAHVLRGGYYHRIRREFALAYTKIADAASGRVSTVAWHDKSDLRSLTGLDLIHWICEPIVPTTENDTET